MANKARKKTAKAKKSPDKHTESPPVAFSKSLKNTHHERFSQEYHKSLNATDAYKIAYPKSSQKAAEANGIRLIGTDRVSSRIKYLQSLLSDTCGVTARMLLEELKKIGFSNIDDYLRIDNEGNVIGRDFDTIDRSKLAAIESIKQTINITSNKDGDKEYETRNFTFKLHSKLVAIQDMGKMIGAYLKDNAQKADAMTRLLENIDGKTRGLPK